MQIDPHKPCTVTKDPQSDAYKYKVLLERCSEIKAKDAEILST